MDLRQRISRAKLQLFILGLAILSFLPDFRDTAIPCHDTRQYLSAFQVFYSHFFHHGDFPLWLPFGRYGIVSALMMTYITPIGFVTAGIGKMLGVTDVLLLYKFCVLSEYLLFIWGTVKLCLLFFERYESVLLVSVGAIFSFSWMLSLDANFHTFYMLPFVFRYLTLFLSTGRVRQLMLCGVFCVFSCIGNVPYHPPFLVVLITLYSLAMLAQGSLRGKRLAFSFGDLAPLLVIVAGGAAFIGLYVLNIDGLESYSLGRDPITHRVEKEVFLSYGGVSKLPKLAKEYLIGGHTQGDNTFYLGLAPLYFMIIAFFQCRRKECLAVAVIAGFLICFSFGGATASLIYYFPGMSLYRHVSLVFGQARLFILLLAGFGLDSMLLNAYSASPKASLNGWQLELSSKTIDGKIRIIVLIALGAEAVISLFSAFAPWGYALWPHVNPSNPPLGLPILRAIVYAVLVAFGVLLIQAAKLRGPARFSVLLHVVLLGFVFDIGAFKIKGFMDWPAAIPEDIARSRELFQPRKMAFSNHRSDPKQIWAENKLLRFVVAQGVPNQCVYVHVWEVSHTDPCQPLYRTDFLSIYVSELLTRKQLNFTMNPHHPLIPDTDHWMTNALGMTAPKLRLISSESLDSKFMEPDPPKEGPSPHLGDISNPEMSANRVTATVRVEPGVSARLFYSDAYHPGWRAFVNGSEVPIERTDVAFKSIALQPGTQNVEFRFFNGWGSRCLYVLAFCSLGLVCYSVFDLLRRNEERLPEPAE